MPYPRPLGESGRRPGWRPPRPRPKPKPVNWFPGLRPGTKVGQSILDSTPRGPFFSGGFNGLADAGNPYAGAIGGQPDLSGLEAEFGAQSRADAASRDAALRRFAVSYGQLPDFNNLSISQDALGYLKNAWDDKTRALAAAAEKEGVSVHARQAKDDATQRRRIPALLAGRGMLRSGQTGFDFGEQAQSYKNLQYDTLNELLGNIEGTISNFQQAERDRAMQLAMARMNAAWDAYGGWGDTNMDGGYDYSSYGAGPTSTRPGRPAPRRTPVVAPGRRTAVYRPGRRTQGGV